MNNHPIFDYAIIGAGAAGLQLALALLEDPFFREKKLLVIEPASKTLNDRTWSFWEKGEGKFDCVVSKQWSNAAFINRQLNLEFSLAPYAYKSIRGLDFYSFSLRAIRQSSQCEYVNDEVVSVEEGDVVVISTAGGKRYQAKLVFDSRLPEAYEAQKSVFPMVLQHFKGWMVETPMPVFNEARFTMMDFSVRKPDTTSFMYVLPHSSTKALVEFTFFSTELEKEEVYDAAIEKYLRDKLRITEYKIAETEYGVIPMSSFPFHKYHSERVIKIGTAGGWVKPGSGYSFRNAMKNTERIVRNLKMGLPVTQGLCSTKHRWYDKLLLDILQRENGRGPEIFTQMYQRNTPSQIFSFLDEETTLVEDLKIISSFHPLPFIAALFRTLGR